LAKIEFFLVAAKLFQNLEFSFAPETNGEFLKGVLRGFDRRPRDYKIIVKRR
jgi:hypothetical protein